jgi:hypothetical protein
MWDNAIEASKGNIGLSYPNISVAAILSAATLVYLAISQFRAGRSLTHVILFRRKRRIFSSFDEHNINGECQYDNAFNGNHLLLIDAGWMPVMKRHS